MRDQRRNNYNRKYLHKIADVVAVDLSVSEATENG